LSQEIFHLCCNECSRITCCDAAVLGNFFFVSERHDKKKVAIIGQVQVSRERSRGHHGPRPHGSVVLASFFALFGFPTRRIDKSKIRSDGDGVLKISMLTRDPLSCEGWKGQGRLVWLEHRICTDGVSARAFLNRPRELFGTASEGSGHYTASDPDRLVDPFVFRINMSQGYSSLNFIP
jgi:hypothetical protein